MKVTVRRLELLTNRQGVAPYKTSFFVYIAVITPYLERFRRNVRFTEMVIYFFGRFRKIAKSDY